MNGPAAAERRLSRAIALLTMELKLQTLLTALERWYAPDQPRVPAGNADGGQWTGAGGSPGSRASGSRAGRPIRMALVGKLDKVELLHTDGTYFWMCNYRDMLGRRWGRSLQIDRLCPQTYPAPPVKGQ